MVADLLEKRLSLPGIGLEMPLTPELCFGTGVVRVRPSEESNGEHCGLYVRTSDKNEPVPIFVEHSVDHLLKRVNAFAAACSCGTFHCAAIAVK